MFLLYHYFEAREAYNAIRVLIAGYVWMTGYGNFHYYYRTGDYCVGRFAQMMWRLNFLVAACCVVMRNNYMLYYICPMHTLFTVLVYAALGIGNQLNSTRWGIGLKMGASLAVVVAVWNVEGVFHAIWRPFTFLVGYSDPRRNDSDVLHGAFGTPLPLAVACTCHPNACHILLQQRDAAVLSAGIDSYVSASKLDSLAWRANALSRCAEWFFRSGLDRYVWIWGMVLAWVHPHAETCWKFLDELRPTKRFAARAAIVAAVATCGYVWYTNVYTLPKLEYNAIHPYTSWIPLTLWIVARNLTPALRSHSLGLFGWLGCITLETYIGQFHIWLRSNIPDGQPKWILDLVRLLRSVLASCCFGRRAASLCMAVCHGHVCVGGRMRRGCLEMCCVAVTLRCAHL